MEKVAFIIPGFFQYTIDTGYREVVNAYKKKGFRTVFVNINWAYHGIFDYLEDFKKIYLAKKGEYKEVFGFSYGAMIALMSAEFLKPDMLSLCSLTPYFKEDLKYIPLKEKASILNRRWNDIEKCEFDKIVKDIRIPTSIFYGENEQEFVIRRAKIASNKLTNSKLFEIKNAGHDIANKYYYNAVINQI
jgi:hypothetical protein